MSDASRHFFGQMPEMPYKIGQEPEKEPDLGLESIPDPVHVHHVVPEGACCCLNHGMGLVYCGWCPIHGSGSTHVV